MEARGTGCGSGPGRRSACGRTRARSPAGGRRCRRCRRCRGRRGRRRRGGRGRALGGDSLLLRLHRLLPGLGRVVGHVPPAPLQDERGGGQEAADGAPAELAGGQHRRGDALPYLVRPLAALALVVVGRHGATPQRQEGSADAPFASRPGTLEVIAPVPHDCQGRGCCLAGRGLARPSLTALSLRCLMGPVTIRSRRPASRDRRKTSTWRRGSL